MGVRTIDIHPHVISPDVAAYPRAPLDGDLSGWPAMPAAPFEHYIEAMAEAGVDKAALVQSSTTYGYDNAYVADAVSAHPDRFTGICTVDMLADDAPEKIRHWIVDRGLGGVRVFTAGSNAQSARLSDPRTFAGWDMAADLGIPVCLQMWMAGLPHLRILLDRYREVPILLDHFLAPSLRAGPPYVEAQPLLELASYPNVYLKFTPIVVRNASDGQATPETFLRRIVQAFGASRVAWGSNFPSSGGSLKDLLEISQNAVSWASADERAWIFRGTAARLYPTLAASGAV